MINAEQNCRKPIIFIFVPIKLFNAMDRIQDFYL